MILFLFPLFNICVCHLLSLLIKRYPDGVIFKTQGTILWTTAISLTTVDHNVQLLVIYTNNTTQKLAVVTISLNNSNAIDVSCIHLQASHKGDEHQSRVIWTVKSNSASSTYRNSNQCHSAARIIEEVCVDPRPSDRNVRRWPLLLSGAGRRRSILVTGYRSTGQTDGQTSGRTPVRRIDAYR